MSFDLLTKVSRLVNGQRYTSNDLASTQEAYASSIQMASNEIWSQASLIPSSSLPYSSSASPNTTQSAGILTYWYRYPLTMDNSATATGSSVWFFTSPSGSTSGIGGQLIDSGQQTNFISPKYGIPGISGFNAESSTPGYAVTINSSSNDTSFGFVNPNTFPYQFDYKTGILEFTSTAIPTGNLYATLYQYNGQFLNASLTNITASNLLVTGTITGTSSYSLTSSYVPNQLTGGVPNYLATWASSNSLGTSSLYQSGSYIGFNTVTPTYPLHVNGTIAPVGDGISSLGSPTNRFNTLYAESTTVGAFFEVGLRTENIGKNPTGTIVIWQNGKLIPSNKEEDEMVMGVIKQDKDEPIILGAEFILVTGNVDEGDYIVTSNKEGHGKAIKRGLIFKKDLFGKVIAQALEASSENSKLIKAMIRKF